MVLVKGKIRQMGSEEWESFEESVEPRIDTNPENMRRQMKMHFHLVDGEEIEIESIISHAVIAFSNEPQTEISF